jgi:LPXTG-motif cell wall-anchored protein
MLQALRNLWVGVIVFLTPLALYAQAEPKNTAYKGEGPRSSTGEAFKDLMSAWWLWAGIIIILGLVGLLFYLRNKTDD